MKFTPYLFLVAVWPTILTAQHIPICGGNGHNWHPICYAYAQGCAFGASWASGDCQLQSLGVDQFRSEFFENMLNMDSLDNSIKNIQQGDVLYFNRVNGPHYAYVTSIGDQTIYGITLAQVDHTDGSVFSA